MRIVTSYRGEFGEEAADCIWESGIPGPNLSSEKEYEADYDAWYSKQPFRTPEAKGSFGGDLEVLKDLISLKNETLQVIVKLANIILTPEQPDYPGGKGMLKVRTNASLRELIAEVLVSRYAKREYSFQFHICACHLRRQILTRLTLLQYYDSENISESKLAFRRATSEPIYHEQDDGKCMRVLYDMDR